MKRSAHFEGWHRRSAQAAAARSGNSLAGDRGFTLVEILLVLAMMAMAGAVLLPAAGAIVRRGGPENPADLVADVLQTARREAVLTGRTVTLRFDREAQRFSWDGAVARSRAVDGERLQVDFLPRGATSAVLIGGNLVETGAKNALQFYPDGTCDPVRVQLRPTGGTAAVLAIDPWTCAPGLEVAP